MHDPAGTHFLSKNRIQPYHLPPFHVLHRDTGRRRDFTHHERTWLTRTPDAFERSIHLFLGDDNNHTDAHVECSCHLKVFNLPDLLDPLPDGRQLPRRGVDCASESRTRREDSRNVLNETTASDVAHTLEQARSDTGQELLDVDSGWSQEGLAEGGILVPRSRVGVRQAGSSSHFTDERETVRVNAGRGETDEDVAGLNVGCRQDEITLDSTDSEASQVVVVCTG